MNDEQHDSIGDSVHAERLDDLTAPSSVPSQLTMPLNLNIENYCDREFEVAREEFPETLGRFVAREQIACGGMGIIVRARDLAFRRDVACKILLNRHASNPKLVERFLLEARVTANLQHPGIIPVYELDHLEDGRPFFAMKLVEGDTLQSMLKPGQHYNSQHLKTFERVCQTLAYCHSKGVVHLDLKPANIMVGPFGEVHLMDWGLARICEDGCSIAVGSQSDFDEVLLPADSSSGKVSTHGYLGGTPSYMSPEQARGETVSLQSDVFGLGAILCEILTGEQLYVGSTQRKVLLRAAKADLSNVHQKLEKLGTDKPLVRLAQRCISVDPDDRPLNAGAVATEVTAYLEAILQEGMSDWHRFFEISLDLFCIASFDGFFLRVNGNFSRVLGYPETELIARPFLEFVHKDDVERTIAVMSVLRDGIPVFRFRNRYRHASGRYLTLEWAAKSVLDQRTIFAVARDVTPH